MMLKVWRTESLLVLTVCCTLVRLWQSRSLPSFQNNSVNLINHQYSVSIVGNINKSSHILSWRKIETKFTGQNLISTLLPDQTYNVLARSSFMMGNVHGFDSVCIVGNAESLSRARGVHEMWGGRFPSFWYIWGKAESAAEETFPIFYHQRGDLSFVHGLETMIQAALSSSHVCRWIFTHDDDLEFRFSPVYFDIKRTRGSVQPSLDISTHLLDVLNEFDPAVAGFPWEGVSSIGAMCAGFKSSYVCPLTGFDNGMVIYRRDILPLVVPFRPRGEGGIHGNWTVGCHYLNMILPWTFKSSAVCIHSLNYSNTINLDVQRKKNPDGRTVISWQTDTLAQPTGSRHPYEYKLNQRYTDFLKSGLKSFVCERFGKQLLPKDVTWIPERGQPQYSVHDMLRRVRSFYDLRHPGVAGTDLVVRNREAASAVYSATRIKLSIHVFTYNRPNSFFKSWSELQSLLLPDSFHDGSLKVEVHIHKDYCPDVDDYIPSSLDSILGPVHIHRNMERRGLRQQMMDAWMPEDMDTFGVFLEDDIAVSRTLLLYADSVIRRWFYDIEFLHPRLAGFSLYNQQINEVLNSNTGFSYNGRPVLWTMPQTWGAIWAPRFWKKFRAWFDNTLSSQPDNNMYIEAGFSNRWPFASSYKKALLRYMRSSRFGLLYPNFPDMVSITEIRGDLAGDGKAEHGTQKVLTQYAVKKPQRLINEDELAAVLSAVPKHRNLPLWSPWEGPSHARNGTMWEYETLVSKCTMVVLSADAKLLREALQHYTMGWGLLSKIIVVWNDPTKASPTWLQHRFAQRNPTLVWLNPSQSSLNNRFAVYDHVETECVISVDDDVVIPHDALDYLFKVWRGDFFQQIVVDAHFARRHYHDGAHWRYDRDSSSSWSLGLPGGGAVFHRKLLKEYMQPAYREARALVDRQRSCDAVVFNIVATKLSGRGPAVIEALASLDAGDSNARGADRLENDEKSLRGEAKLVVQDECVQLLLGMFGSESLVTTTFLLSRHANWLSAGVPGRHHYRSLPIQVSTWVNRSLTRSWAA